MPRPSRDTANPVLPSKRDSIFMALLFFRMSRNAVKMVALLLLMRTVGMLPNKHMSWTGIVLNDLGVDPFIDGFRLVDVTVDSEMTVRASVGGKGPPLLLLHGHPQTHVTWRKVGPRLAAHYTVVAADLRGYGDSSKPEGGKDHCAYAKRAMARDQVLLMKALGHQQFGIVGH